MKKSFILLLLIPLFCFSCSDDEQGDVAESGLRRVVIAYIMAENSLSTASTYDLDEIRSAVTLIPSDCRMVVFLDNSSTAKNPQIISFDSQRGEQVVYEYSSDVVSTDGEVMEQALQYIIDNNPAREYALILWSHASGWVPPSNSVSSLSIGIDNGKNTSSNSGEEMAISTLREVLEDVGVHWTYIFYDACFMQCVEVAFELRHLTDWSMGSPAEIVDTGAPYDRLMPYFFEASGYANDLVEQYFMEYENSQGALLSAIRSDALEALAAATATVLTPLDDYPTTDLQAYCAYASSTGWKPEYYDMGSCISHWAGAAVYDEWATALNEAVPYRYATTTWVTSYSSVFRARLTDQEHYAGVSMYFPISGRDEYNDYWREYEWYDAVGYLFDR